MSRISICPFTGKQLAKFQFSDFLEVPKWENLTQKGCGISQRGWSLWSAIEFIRRFIQEPLRNELVGFVGRDAA